MAIYVSLPPRSPGRVHRTGFGCLVVWEWPDGVWCWPDELWRWEWRHKPGAVLARWWDGVI